jgi:type VI secretion system protein ImpB
MGDGYGRIDLMAQNVAQRRAGRLRAPRVQIAYDLRVGGEDRRKELPFVVGVLGEFAGTPEPPLPKLREREFVEVNAGTLDTVLRSLRPRLAFSVPNRLTAEESKLAVTLRFERLEDFGPERVAQQVAPLRDLLALRRQLVALRAVARNDASVHARLRQLGALQKAGGSNGDEAAGT